MVTKTKELQLPVLDNVSNGAKDMIEAGRPYVVDITVQGVAVLLMHGWNIEAVEAKSKAAKGSTTKKTDDIESYVYRMPSKGKRKGNLALNGDSLRAAMALAAKYRQDPRSPRKSASDLVKQGLIPLNPFADLGVNNWEFVASHRVRVQNNSITRRRPALNIGWKCRFEMLVNVPEYLTPEFLQELLRDAGTTSALGDYRPTYGRFTTIEFKTRDF